MFSGTSQGLTFCCYRLFLDLHLIGPTAKRLVLLIFIFSAKWPPKHGRTGGGRSPSNKKTKDKSGEVSVCAKCSKRIALDASPVSNGSTVFALEYLRRSIKF